MIIRSMRKSLEALLPLKQSVFNDNGDMTVSTPRFSHNECIEGYFAYRTAEDAIAKYEVAKAQESDRQKECSEWFDSAETQACPKCGGRGEYLIGQGNPGMIVKCDCKMVYEHEEKGFPVVKVPGHVVNHIEWRDHALIVTVGPRQAPEPRHLVKRLKRMSPINSCICDHRSEDISMHALGCTYRLIVEAADRIETLEAEKRS